MKRGITLTASFALLLAACAPAAGAAAPPAPIALWRTDGGGFTPAQGKVDPKAPCQLLTVSLDRRKGGPPPPPPPEFHGKPSACQASSLYLGYLRGTLFIEGLDADGARLFVATGLNPLHQDVEAPPSPSAAAGWRASDASAPVLTTTIRAPLTASLARLRWYDVDGRDQPHLLGEAKWNAPLTPKP